MPKQNNLGVIGTGDFTGMMSRSVCLFNRAESTINEEKRTVRAIITTEQIAQVMDWERWEIIDEILLRDGAEFPASGQVPLLNNHSRYELTDILGSASDIVKKDDGWDAELRVSTLEEAENAWILIKEKHLTDVSIGYRTYPDHTVMIAPGESTVIGGKSYKNDGKRTLAIRKKWTVKEVSLVPIGADTRAKMRSENQINPKSGGNMPETLQPQTERQSSETPPAVTQLDKKEVRKEAVKLAKSTRENEEKIRNYGKAMNIADADIEESVRTATDADGIIDVDACRKACDALMDKSRKAMEPLPPKKQGEGIRVETDSYDNFRSIAPAALMMSGGMRVDNKQVDEVRKSGYSDMTLLGVCRMFLELNNVRGASIMSPAQVYEHCVSARNSMLYGRSFAQSTSDFANIFLDVALKSAGQGWEEAGTTYQAVAGTDKIPNFMTKNVIKLSGMGDAQKLINGEGFPFTSMGDSKETGFLFTIGLAWGIDRKSIINDELGLLTRGPFELYASIRRYINRLYWETFYGTAMAGATMGEDNTAMFTAGHANFVASDFGAAPSTTTISTAKRLMTKQTRPVGDPKAKKQYTNYQPSHIIYHGDLDQTVLQLISSTFDHSSSDSSNKPNLSFIRSLTPVTDPVLDELMDANTHKGWYLQADPRRAPSLNVYSLTGFESPTMRQKVSDVAEPLGTMYDIFYDVGCGPVDFRHAVANFGK